MLYRPSIEEDAAALLRAVAPVDGRARERAILALVRRFARVARGYGLAVRALDAGAWRIAWSGGAVIVVVAGGRVWRVARDRAPVDVAARIGWDPYRRALVVPDRSPLAELTSGILSGV